MKTTRVQIIIVIISGLSLLTQAQNTPRQPIAIHALVGEVSDYRSTSNSHSRCSVELTFVGNDIAEATDVIQVRPSKVTDDLNQDLLPVATANTMIFHFSEYSLTARNETNQLTAPVFLRSPARAAKTIKTLEGEVELFMPTIANGGRVVISDFSRSPQTAANNPALKKLGIEVTYQTKEMFEIQKRSPSKKTSYLQHKWPGSSVVARIFVNTTSHIPLRVELETNNETGLNARLNRFYERGVRCLELTNQPPLGTKLSITTMTPETRKTFRFKVENIPIP